MLQCLPFDMVIQAYSCDPLAKFIIYDTESCMLKYYIGRKKKDFSFLEKKGISKMTHVKFSINMNF
jgi:hypothetical protein